MNNIKEQIAALNNANNVLANLANKTLNNIMDSLNTDIIVFPFGDGLQLNWGNFSGTYTAISRDNEKRLTFDMCSSDGSGTIDDINTPRGIDAVLALIDHTMTLIEQGVSLVPDLSEFEEIDERIANHQATIVSLF